ncbi:MAG TPA: tetratricopeptide repeat protein [Candidatus Acidoferrum sp.]|nr:tetratricopeptide repeat protein [Candidatus Acidoferrum sp.]
MIGPLRLDGQRKTLSAGGIPLGVGPRVVATLAALVERRGEVVTKDELLDGVWHGEDVGESNVAQSVYVLRKIFREHGLGEAIVTVPRRGYRFTGAVRRADEEISATDPPAARPRHGARVRALWNLAAAVLVMTIGGATGRSSSPSPALGARGAELYRLGRFYWNRRTLPDLAHAVALFTAVTRSDPHSPLGFSGLADSELMIADYADRAVHQDLHLERAAAAVRSALAADPRSAEAHTSYGELLLMRTRDVAASNAEFRRAIALDPAYANAHHWYGVSLLEHGSRREALRQLQQAVVLDPTSSARAQWLAIAAYYERHFADAIGYNQRALELDPQRSGALRGLGLAYELAGDYEHAVAVFKRMRATPGDADDAPGLLAEAYARAGHLTAAKRWLEIAIRRRPHDLDTALALLAVGEHARAVAVLNAISRAEWGTYSPDDPRLDPLRGDRTLRLQASAAAS